jgi:1-deoxy-D-xylulose-5-phosphate reductoisomerase
MSLTLAFLIAYIPTMKKVVILGSTGSLGKQAIEVLKKYKEDFKIIALCANKNKKLLNTQAKSLKIHPKNVILASENSQKKIENLAKLKEVDIVINVISGTLGIVPSKIALKSNKILLLGNKESLVAEGEKIMELAKKNTQTFPLIPLDSEHNAIFEILKKNPGKKIKKIIIPCSGGPFLGKTKAQLKKVTAKDALSHPKWKMGPKITIESATLINKGFEIIEAHYLFSLPLDKIETRIHPECKIHGIVEFQFPGTKKTEKIAYISKPDMREHIQNALLRAINKPTPAKSRTKPLQESLFALTKPDQKILNGIEIVLKHFKKNPRKMEAFLKKEESVINRFLQNEIKFLDIFTILG